MSSQVAQPLSRRTTIQPDQSGLYSLVISSTQVAKNFAHDEDVCAGDNEDCTIEVVEYASDPCQTPTSNKFTSASALSKYLSASSCDARSELNRVIFLHQQDSWDPICASKAMIYALKDHYELSSGFLRILDSFRYRQVSTEEAFCGPVRTVSIYGRSECGYVFRYAEEKQGKPSSPWAIRQTGIYHVYDLSKSISTVIVICPSPTTQYRTRIMEIMQDADTRAHVAANPVVYHMALISTYFSSWRGYLRHYEALLSEMHLTSYCAALDLPLVKFETLQDLRAIEYHILVLRPLMQSLGDQLIALKWFDAKTKAGSEDLAAGDTIVLRAALDDFRREAHSYLEAVEYLCRRAQSIAQSVSDILNLTQSNSTLALASSARKDSIAIKALTLVTAVYLPFSFVATIFGMNFVAFDDISHKLLVSTQLWIYFAISIPLTILTLAGWKWSMWRRRDRRRKTDEMDHAGQYHV